MKQTLLISIVTVILALAPALAATPAQFGTNVQLTAGQDFTSGQRVETTIAVNPLDPMNLAAGFIDLPGMTLSQGCRSASSADGGTTWSAGGLVPLQRSDSVSHDPSVTVDANGTFFYSYLEDMLVPGRFGGTVIGRIDIDVARSTDGGQTFSAFSVAVPTSSVSTAFPDNPQIAADAWPKSRFQGAIYVSYTDLHGVQIRVVSSRDGGLTWSPPVGVSAIATQSTPEVIQGSVPAVAPDGTAYVFYADGLRPTGPGSIKFSRSKDGGRSWSAPADAASNLPTPIFFVIKNGDPQFGLQPDHGLFVTTTPAVAIAPDGSIDVAWNDFPNGSCVDLGGFAPACVNAEVRLARSLDGGKSWSLPVSVTDGAARGDRFFPTIAIPPGGLVNLAWLDRRLDSANINYDVFYTNTGDGSTFLPNQRVTTETSELGSLTFIGDYIGLAATQSAVFPIWGDLRTRNNEEIFAARGSLQP